VGKQANKQTMNHYCRCSQGGLYSASILEQWKNNDFTTPSDSRNAVESLTLFWILGGGLRCALIGCQLGPGKSEKGWDFGGEGTKGAMGTKGSSSQATWD
jgi:hypothetical protein